MSSGGTENPQAPAQVIPASLADLVERPLYAHLATVRPDAGSRGGEHGKKSVPHCGHLVPTVGRQGVANEAMMLRQEARIRRLTEAPEQCRRALDVGEEKGQGSRGTSLSERPTDVWLPELALAGE